MSRCCITQVDPKEPRHLPFALADDERNPPLGVIAAAQSRLIEALTAEPLPAAVLELAFARMLSECGHKSEDRDAAIDGLVEAVGLACDPLARELDLWPTTDGPIAPIVFAFALLKLKATKTYFPKPAEVRKVLVEVHRRLWREVLVDLAEQYKRRLAVDECILINGPQSDDLTFQMRRRFALESAGLLPSDDDEQQAEQSSKPALAACDAKPPKRTKKITMKPTEESQ